MKKMSMDEAINEMGERQLRRLWDVCGSPKSDWTMRRVEGFYALEDKQGWRLMAASTAVVLLTVWHGMCMLYDQTAEKPAAEPSIPKDQLQ